MASAFDLGGRMGIDIKSSDFWNGSYEVVKTRIDRYEQLVEEQLSGR